MPQVCFRIWNPFWVPNLGPSSDHTMSFFFGFGFSTVLYITSTAITLFAMASGARVGPRGHEANVKPHV